MLLLALIELIKFETYYVYWVDVNYIKKFLSLSFSANLSRDLSFLQLIIFNFIAVIIPIKFRSLSRYTRWGNIITQSEKEKYTNNKNGTSTNVFP